jgi:hypothetical protein
MRKPTIFPRTKAMKAANLAAKGKISELQSFLNETIESAPDSAWAPAFIKFNKWLEAPTKNELPYNVFMKGNGKLPFMAFSALPFVTCPGMGECSNFCYSLKAWRYPAPFLRQVMNTILIKFHKEVIAEKFMEIKKNMDVRLYVDGDIHDTETLIFWMELLKTREDLNAYGYSKSWEIFIDLHNSGYEWPTNYELNQSSGSRYQNVGPIRMALKQLPIYRGEFIAIDIDQKSSSKEVKELAKKLGLNGKSFVCAGYCGSCIPTKNGKGNIHACGSNKMKGVNVLIPIH